VRRTRSADQGDGNPSVYRDVQLLFGQTKVESTVKHLGIEVDDALALAEQIDAEHQAERSRSAHQCRALLAMSRPAHAQDDNPLGGC
jgi:hypothetical protein